jgi:hypothetical protein
MPLTLESLVGKDLPHCLRNGICLRHNLILQVLSVRHWHVHGSYSLNRSSQIVERRSLIDNSDYLCANSRLGKAVLHCDQPASLLHALNDSVPSHRLNRPQVDDLAGNALLG